MADSPQELTIFDPDIKGYRHSIVMHDIQKISNKPALFLADKYAYALNSLNEGEFGTPVSYYLQSNGYDYFTPAPGIACNLTGEDNSRLPSSSMSCTTRATACSATSAPWVPR